MLDLSGTPAPWPADAAAIWRSCASPETSSDPAGGPDALRAAMAELLGAGPTVRVTSGVRPTIPALSVLGRTVLLESPTFAGVRRAFERCGVSVVLGPLDQLLRHGGRPREQLLWITSPGRNPDGWTAPRSMVAALTRFIDHGGLVVQNETYRWHGAPTLPVPGVIQIGSFAKVAGPDARLGWLSIDAAAMPSGWMPSMAGVPVPAPGVQGQWAQFIAAGGMDLLIARAAASAAVAAQSFAVLAGERPRDRHGVSFLVRTRSEDPASALLRMGILANPGPAFQATPDTARLCFLGCDKGCDHSEVLAQVADQLGARPVRP